MRLTVSLPNRQKASMLMAIFYCERVINSSYAMCVLLLPCVEGRWITVIDDYNNLTIMLISTLLQFESKTERGFWVSNLIVRVFLLWRLRNQKSCFTFNVNPLYPWPNSMPWLSRASEASTFPNKTTAMSNREKKTLPYKNCNFPQKLFLVPRKILNFNFLLVFLLLAQVSHFHFKLLNEMKTTINFLP